MERLTEYGKYGFAKIKNNKKFYIRNTIERLAKIEDILGDNYDLDRLRELVEADRDGRCVIRPKDYDGTIFRVWKNQILSSENFAWFMKELGKNFFLTREAAEAALKGGQNG